jgi:hypothetical protein
VVARREGDKAKTARRRQSKNRATAKNKTAIPKSIGGTPIANAISRAAIY